MEYYSAIKSNKVLIQVVTWMKLENISMLSEKRPSQKITCYMSSFMWNVQKGQIYTEKISGCQSVGNKL